MLEIFKILVSNNKSGLLEPKRQKEVGCTNNPNYCHYHRIISHSTNNYFILKDKLQTLVDADELRLNKEKKKVTTNMISMQFWRDLPGVKMLNRVLVSKVMTRIVNTDSSHQ